MFNIFKQTKEVTKEIFPSKKEVEIDTIQKIHNSFDIAGDKALMEANLILEKHKNRDREKARLLKNLGFINTNEAKALEQVLNEENKATIRAKIVASYKQEYPFLKIIFKDQVTEICNKYKLVCGGISRYMGDVPLKNLREIENFELKSKHILYARTDWGNNLELAENEDFHGCSLFESSHIKTIQVLSSSLEESFPFNKTIEQKLLPDELLLLISCPNYISQHEGRRALRKLNFLICAPSSDMKVNEKTQKNGAFLSEIPDPIVLYRQEQDRETFYIIVSKWGLEASDSLVMNEIDN